MAVGSVSMYVNESTIKTEQKNSRSEDKKASEISQEKEEKQAVVVEKGQKEEKVTYSKKSNKVDQATIDRLKQEAEERTSQLRKLVEKLLCKQSQTFDDSLDMYDLIRSGKLQIDDETRLQAQKDIAEDGYWGVEQTSERLFSFATALSGYDKEKADQMVEAFKEGYAQAEKKWGGKLPEICQRTYDAFIKKMDEWKNSSEEE